MIFALHKNSMEDTTTKPQFIGLDIKLKNLFYNENNQSNVNVKLVENDSIKFLENYNDKKKIFIYLMLITVMILKLRNTNL